MQALVIKLSKYIFATVTTSAAGKFWTFDTGSVVDIARANIAVYAIEAYTAAEAVKDQLGNSLIAAAGAPSLMVTLKDTKGKVLMENYAMQTMRKSQNNGCPVYLDNYKVDISKSGVFQTATTSVSNGEVAGFNIAYFFLQ